MEGSSLPIHALETRRVRLKFEHRQQRALINEISGAFQTGTQQSKWDNNVTDMCPYCTEVDTREHRIYHCPATADIRESHASFLQKLTDLGWDCHDLPVITHRYDDDFLHTVCDFVAEPCMDETLQTRLGSLPAMNHHLRFYTDGSCCNPTMLDASHAAFAVVLDCAPRNDARCQQAKSWQPGVQLDTLRTIIAARVTGEQNIHGAEISALIFVCEQVSAAEVVTDSQVAVSLGCKCLLLQDPRELYAQHEPDLAIRLWHAVQTGTYTFTKVKAHQDIENCLEPLLKYDRLGNQQANDAALLACQHMQPSLVAEVNQLAASLSEQQRMLRDYFCYFLDLQRDRAKLRKQSHQHEQHVLQPAVPDTICDKLMRYQPQILWELPAPTVDHGRDWAWGPTWGHLFNNWLSQLQWPNSPQQVEFQDIGLTWIELAMSLMLTTELWLPLRRRGRGNKDRLVVFGSFDELAAYQTKFIEFADTVQQMFTQMATLRNSPLHPPAQRLLVTYTYIQGFSIHSSGLSIRPSMPGQSRFLPILARHLQTYKGPGWTTIPNLQLVNNDRLLATIRTEVQGVWADRCRRSQMSANRLKTVGRLRLQPLRFH